MDFHQKEKNLDNKGLSYGSLLITVWSQMSPLNSLNLSWVICQIKNGIDDKLSSFIDPSLCTKLFTVFCSFLHIILKTGL